MYQTPNAILLLATIIVHPLMRDICAKQLKRIFLTIIIFLSSFSLSLSLSLNDNNNDQQVLHTVPRGMAADVNAAVAAAKAAFANSGWASLSAVQRAEKVVKMAKGIKTNVRMLAEVEAADVGKSTHDAEMAISGAAGEGEHWCLYAATLDAEQDMPVGPTASGDALPLDVVYRRDPIGVVGKRQPYSSTIYNCARKRH